MAAQGPSAGRLGEPADVTMEEAAAAAERPESENRPAAAIEPDERSEESDSSELDDWEWLRQNDTFFLEPYYPPRVSAQPDEWRARREEVERKHAEFEASPEGIALNAEVDALLAKSYGSPGWLGLRQELGELELTERAALMFKVERSGPVASGRLPCAQIVTKEQLYLAWKAIEDVAKDRGRGLTQAYGNFDKLCGLGWLLGDVMCGRLIDGTDAYGIGRRLGKSASKLMAEFDAPLRRFGKRKYASDEERERDRAAAAEEEAAIRRESVVIGLEEEAAAPAAPTSETPPPPPPPQPPPAPAPRNPERLERLKLLREAERLLSNAKGALAAANRKRDHAKAAWEYALEQSRNPHRSAQIPEERWAAWDKQEKATLESARARYIAAEWAIGGPEQALVWAKLEAKEARFDLDEYEKELRRQGRRRAREAEEEEKWEQIKEDIECNNTMHPPGDPGHWEPDAWEYAQLHRMWKLQ